jgi:hypothetical protein
MLLVQEIFLKFLKSLAERNLATEEAESQRPGPCYAGLLILLLHN